MYFVCCCAAPWHWAIPFGLRVCILIKSQLCVLNIKINWIDCLCTLSLISPFVCFACSTVPAFSIELIFFTCLVNHRTLFLCSVAIVTYQLSFLSWFWLAQERASSRIDQGTSQLVPSNNNSAETPSSTSRPRVTVNDRLPGAVLLARARLLERLRGVSLSGNRWFRYPVEFPI